MSKQLYKLEISGDGKTWIHKATFMEGEKSRIS